MQRIDREFSVVLRTLRLLMSETERAMALTLKYKNLEQTGEATYAEVRIAYKILIRVFFTLVDATGTILRSFIVKTAAHQGLELSEKWQKKLRSKRLGADENVKLAFRFFPQVFGSDLAIDFSGQEWGDFRDLANVRHRMTHPQVVDDTLPPLGFLLIGPVARWFLGSLAALLGDAARKRGRDAPAVDLASLKRVERIERTPDPIFDKETLRKIAESQSRTLEYVSGFFSALADETRQVTDWFGERFRGDFDSEAQFGARILTISMFSEMEGVANAAQFLIEAAQENDAVTISPADEALLEPAGPATRYANVLTLWSRTFGDGSVVHRRGDEWRSVGLTSRYRDRFIHPDTAADLRVSLDMITHILGTMAWLSTAHRAGLTLDPDRWAGLAWGIRKATQ